MPMGTPESISQKWSTRLQAARRDYEEGIRAVTASPMEAAANRSAEYVAGVQEAVRSGKWQRGLRAVTLQEWQNRAIEIGAQRLQTGATANVGKVRAFLAEWLPFLQRNVTQVRAMPKSTFEERVQRMVQMATLNRAFRRGAGGRMGPPAP